MSDLILEPVLDPDVNKLEEAYQVVVDLETAWGKTAVIVPKFFQFDGASIPAPAWQAIGTPFTPRFMLPSVFHDWLYHTHQIARHDADELFFQLLLANGVNPTRAWLMREAVETFGGGYWKNDAGDDAYIARLTQRIIDDRRDPAVYGLPPKN